ncbi:unnamed protein product [Sympodiomycopsis kandeliae]
MDREAERSPPSHNSNSSHQDIHTQEQHPDPPEQELPHPPDATENASSSSSTTAATAETADDLGQRFFEQLSSSSFWQNAARGLMDSISASVRGRGANQDSATSSQPRQTDNPQTNNALGDMSRESLDGQVHVGLATLLPEESGGDLNRSAADPQSTVLYYNLPFTALDGRRALLAIPGVFLPVIQHDDNPTQPQPTPSQPRRVRVTVLAPTNPILIPFGYSFLPFSFLYDQSGWAWPLLSFQNPPPGMPRTEDRHNPHFVVGQPFPLRLSFTGPAGQDGGVEEYEPPDPVKAKSFAQSLETADAELRSRMARLGIGDIGYHMSSDDDDEEQLGCPVCLDNYDDSADRPEWLDGESATDNQVVVIPCKGFHTMHRHCLVAWLSSKSPQKWTCPMCRSSISPDHFLKQNTSKSSKSLAVLSAIESQSASLRDEIHKREKSKGYICDYQACFPDYDHHNEEEENLDRMMIKLAPCGHSLHSECLTTTLRIKNDLKLSGEEEEEEEYEEEDRLRGYKILGKWVECPIDKKESWAKIPVPILVKKEGQIASGQVHRLSSPGDQDDHSAPELKKHKNEESTS